MVWVCIYIYIHTHTTDFTLLAKYVYIFVWRHPGKLLAMIHICVSGVYVCCMYVALGRRVCVLYVVHVSCEYVAT